MAKHGLGRWRLSPTPSLPTQASRGAAAIGASSLMTISGKNRSDRPHQALR
jgi:hypothetical protein